MDITKTTGIIAHKHNS